MPQGHGRRALMNCEISRRPTAWPSGLYVPVALPRARGDLPTAARASKPRRWRGNMLGAMPIILVGTVGAEANTTSPLPCSPRPSSRPTLLLLRARRGAPIVAGHEVEVPEGSAHEYVLTGQKRWRSSERRLSRASYTVFSAGEEGTQPPQGDQRASSSTRRHARRVRRQRKGKQDGPARLEHDRRSSQRIVKARQEERLSGPSGEGFQGSRCARLQTRSLGPVRIAAWRAARALIYRSQLRLVPARYRPVRPSSGKGLRQRRPSG